MTVKNIFGADREYDFNTELIEGEGIALAYSGGDVFASIDINSLIEIGTVDTANDYMPIRDASAGNATKKFSIDNFPSTLAIETAKFEEFLSNGTWYKPAGARILYVIAFGGGGGGGSGRRNSGVIDCFGGGGGGGASLVRVLLQASAVADSVAITVGVSGAGGTGTTVSGGNTAGEVGGDSSFGSHLVAYGGANGGLGGTISTTYGGAAPTLTLYAGAAGGNSNEGATAGAGGNADLGCPGGGGGGTADSTLLRQPGAGGTQLAGNQLGGVAGVSSSIAAGTAGTAGNASASVIFGGSGGGGGGAATLAHGGGNGGAGGFPGAGGGGGGGANGTLTGTPSGNGGNGGAGVIYVITFF